MLPDPTDADGDGVLGVGADLQPSTLVDAYRRGIFPWPHEQAALPWFSPDPRGILEPAALRVSKSLRKTLRSCGWEVTVDAAFAEVVRCCAVTRGDEGTWITTEMARAYQRLHRLGWAHSVEVWDGSELVGGLYGVQPGGVFTGESMFHRRPDASKVALVALVDRMTEAGGLLVDVQITTDHLATLGARDWPRDRFLATLADVRDTSVRMRTDRRPVAWLAPTHT
ncbi:MAG: leucyl/phenylalanyl-tRNA--protein transferase [Glaciecola sp.]|jgi:leucyl/phenylalanyl-tRNA--protein transferase